MGLYVSEISQVQYTENLLYDFRASQFLAQLVLIDDQAVEKIKNNNNLIFTSYLGVKINQPLINQN